MTTTTDIIAVKVGVKIETTTTLPAGATALPRKKEEEEVEQTVENVRVDGITKQTGRTRSKIV